MKIGQKMRGYFDQGPFLVAFAFFVELCGFFKIIIGNEVSSYMQRKFGEYKGEYKCQ